MKPSYLILPRDYFQSPEWTTARTYSDAEALLDIIRSVRYSDTPDIQTVGNRPVTCHKNEWPVSYQFLSQRWQWTVRHVRTFLQRQVRTGRITLRVENATTIIRLVTDGGTPSAAAPAAVQPAPPVAPPAVKTVDKTTVKTVGETIGKANCQTISPVAAESAKTAGKTTDNKNNKEKNKDTINTTSPSTDLREEKNLMLFNSQWTELMCMRYHLTQEQLANRLDEFATDCLCRGLDRHTSLRDAQQHFNNWLLKRPATPAASRVLASQTPSASPIHQFPAVKASPSMTASPSMPASPYRRYPSSSDYITAAQQDAMADTLRIIESARRKRALAAQ